MKRIRIINPNFMTPMTKNWRDEFDCNFTYALNHMFQRPHNAKLGIAEGIKSFITSLIETERAAAVAEYQAKLNNEGLGEDEEFEEFCKEFVKAMPKLAKHLSYEKKA